jgi:hypothetical protein
MDVLVRVALRYSKTWLVKKLVRKSQKFHVWVDVGSQCYSQLTFSSLIFSIELVIGLFQESAPVYSRRFLLAITHTHIIVQEINHQKNSKQLTQKIRKITQSLHGNVLLSAGQIRPWSESHLRTFVSSCQQSRMARRIALHDTLFPN